MSEYRLTAEIVARSSSKNWDEAKLEWYLVGVSEAEEPETCLCGHHPIIELCEIANRKNRNSATVGNCCVKRFLGIRSDKIFSAFKRVRTDNEKALNAETIEFAFDRNWITAWDRAFYFDTIRKRKLSLRQMIQRKRINRAILDGFTGRHANSAAGMND